jgi:magnesium transporter
MFVEEQLARTLLRDHPEQAARLLDRAEPADVAALLAELPAAEAAAVYRELSPAPAAASASVLPDDVLARVALELPLDRAAAILRRLPSERRAELLSRFDRDRGQHLEGLLAYPENTAGALADPLALALPDDITVREAQRQMRGSERHLFYHVFIIGRDRSLRGTLAMQELMGARPRQPLSAVMQRDVVALDALTPLATVAVHPAWREFDALPVIDAERKLIGAIRHRMIRQMAQEQTRPFMETIVGLSELYWAGLSGMLTSLAPTPGNSAETGDAT